MTRAVKTLPRITAHQHSVGLRLWHVLCWKLHIMQNRGLKCYYACGQETPQAEKLTLKDGLKSGTPWAPARRTFPSVNPQPEFSEFQ